MVCELSSRDQNHRTLPPWEGSFFAMELRAGHELRVTAFHQRRQLLHGILYRLLGNSGPKACLSASMTVTFVKPTKPNI